MTSQPFKRSLALLARYLQPQWLKTLLMALMLLLSIALQLYNPRILSSFIDATATHGISTDLIWLALLFICMTIITKLATVVSNYLCENVSWTATNLMRNDLLSHLLTLDQQFHKEHTSGELLERIDGDVNVLANFFSQFIVLLPFHALLLIGMLISLTIINWLLGCVLGLYCVAVVGFLVWMRRPAPNRWRIADQARADLFGFLGEAFSALEDVRPNGGTPYIWQHFYQHFQRWYTTTCKAGWSGGSPWIISQHLFRLGGIVGLVLGAYLWTRGLATPGTVYLIFSYSSLLMQPLEQLQWQIQDLQQAQASIQRIDQLLLHSSSLKNGTGKMPASGPLELSFEHVTFGYTPERPIFKDLSLTLPAGHVLGLVGRTGSGKTTMARLLFRMYDPQEGAIKLNGVALTEMHLPDLRRRLGLITQDVQLFNASVRDNLTFFNTAIQDETILQAFQKVGLYDWYSTLPRGLETKIGNGEYGLSAGEAQLLAFVRSLLAQPDLIILDEASSRLDPLSEQRLEQAIEQLFTGRTGIIIAHRLATLEHVSDILVLEDGNIIEFGSRAELMASPNSHFARLLQLELEAGAMLV
ncbi:ABC transporter ATP-binding protein [Tengunoibacter tsumagoiensis]|uniref:Helicase n=1 Tax=Tengunoibacter tsumagoiensis TaxID=2014871 RepID=A0A402A490_9CHLR|nr:ABC transporter ATP-binding protein [Tengunoibacter tsumagoiensis]GCE13958.1 helicase [Tengunoibacter tsumagoiensis]